MKYLFIFFHVFAPMAYGYFEDEDAGRGGRDNDIARRTIQIVFGFTSEMQLLSDHVDTPFSSRMGYNSERGYILLPIHGLPLESQINLTLFDGETHPISNQAYSIGYDLSGGFVFEFLENKRLTVKPQNGIGMLMFTKTLFDFDDTPDVKISSDLPKLEAIWGTGAYVNSDGAQTLSPMQKKNATQRTSIQALKFTGTPQSKNSFKIQLDGSYRHLDGLVGLLPGAPIFNQTGVQLSIGTANLIGLYNGELDDNFFPVQTTVQVHRSEDFVFTKTKKFRQAIFDEVLIHDSSLIPDLFWDVYIDKYSKSVAGNSVTYFRLQDEFDQFLYRQFSSFLTLDEVKLLNGKLKKILRWDYNQRVNEPGFMSWGQMKTNLTRSKLNEAFKEFVKQQTQLDLRAQTGGLCHGYLSGWKSF